MHNIDHLCVCMCVCVCVCDHDDVGFGFVVGVGGWVGSGRFLTQNLSKTLSNDASGAVVSSVL